MEKIPRGQYTKELRDDAWGLTFFAGEETCAKNNLCPLNTFFGGFVLPQFSIQENLDRVIFEVDARFLTSGFVK